MPADTELGPFCKQTSTTCLSKKPWPRSSPKPLLESSIFGTKCFKTVKTNKQINNNIFTNCNIWTPQDTNKTAHLLPIKEGSRKPLEAEITILFYNLSVCLSLSKCTLSKAAFSHSEEFTHFSFDWTCKSRMPVSKLEDVNWPASSELSGCSIRHQKTRSFGLRTLLLSWVCSISAQFTLLGSLWWWNYFLFT